MNCNDCLALLDRLPWSALPPDRQRELERHLAECPACRADRRFLPHLLAGALALPREMPPGRDLWPGIAARLETPDRRGRPARQRWSRPTILAAAAAALLVLLSAGATALLLRQNPSPAQISLQARQMEQAYQAAAEELTQALETNRAVMGPRAAAAVERSLRDLDAAIAESRRALEAHPGSLELAGFLRDTYQKKIDLLQRSTLAREGS